MKKIFAEPTLELIQIENHDVIATSGGRPDGT